MTFGCDFRDPLQALPAVRRLGHLQPSRSSIVRIIPRVVSSSSISSTGHGGCGQRYLLRIAPRCSRSIGLVRYSAAPSV